MIATRQTFVFSKAHALAKSIPTEPDKKHAAHTVCERLVALLNLNKSPPPLFAIKPQAVQSSSQAEPDKRYSLAFPTAGNAHLDNPLGCGVRA